MDGSSPKGGKVPGTPLWPSPNMAHSAPFTDPLLRIRFGKASGGLALFQCGEKRGAAMVKVRVKLTDFSTNGFKDKMLMTPTMTHHKGISHKQPPLVS